MKINNLAIGNITEEEKTFIKEHFEKQTITESTNLKTIALKEGTISLVDNKGNVYKAKLEKIGNMLTAVLRFKDYLNRCKQFDIPLAYYSENLDELKDLKDIDLVFGGPPCQGFSIAGPEVCFKLTPISFAII